VVSVQLQGRSSRGAKELGGWKLGTGDKVSGGNAGLIPVAASAAAHKHAPQRRNPRRLIS